MDSSQTKVTATREEALAHIRAVEMLHRGGVKIADPVAYFSEKVSELTEQIARESALDPEGKEMKRIREGEDGAYDFWSNDDYFRWLRGVLAHQEAYLAALTS